MQHKLTTIDNPFDPFDEFDQWLALDEQLGYFSCQLLARVSQTSNELSDLDQNLATEQAINDIIELDPLLVFRKVSR